MAYSLKIQEEPLKKHTRPSVIWFLLISLGLVSILSVSFVLNWNLAPLFLLTGVIVAAILMFLLVVIHPTIGWVLFALMLPIGMAVRVSLGPFEIAPSMVVVAPLLLSAFLQKRYTYSQNRKEILFFLLILLLVFVEILGLFRTDRPEWVLALIAKLVFGILIYFLLAKFTTPKQLEAYFLFLSIAIAAYLAITLLYYLILHGASSISVSLQSNMGQSGRNQLAIIVPLVVPPLFSKLISKRYATRFLFLVDGLILGIVLFSILLSLSRSAFLNAFLGISWVFLWSQPWHHKIRLLFMGLILFGAMVFVFSISPVAVGRLVSILEVFGKDVQTYGASTGHSVLVRKELLQTAFDLWRKSPLFGIGSGNFLENTVFVDNSTLNAVTHNEYARWLVELGLFGLSLLLLFLTSHFFYIIHSLKSKVRLDLPRWSIIGISGTFICFVFQMLFININYHYYFWIAMGLTARVIFSKPISMERSLKI